MFEWPRAPCRTPPRARDDPREQRLARRGASLPAACVSNAADLTLSSSRAMVRPGDTVTYTVYRVQPRASRRATSPPASTVRLPRRRWHGAPARSCDPAPRPARASRRDTADDVGTCPTPWPSTRASRDHRAGARATGVVHDAPVHRHRDVEQATWPRRRRSRARVHLRRHPAAGFAPFTTTYDVHGLEHQHDHVPMDPPAIQHTSCPARATRAAMRTRSASSTTARPGATRARGCFPAPPGHRSSTAVASARSRVDNLTVLAPRQQP